MNDTRENDRVIATLDYDRRVMSEEVLHRNPNQSVKILPTKPAPSSLPCKEEMVPVRHRACGGIAFYYTHRPHTKEMMTASRARDINGKRIEPSSIMRCGSCGLNVGGPGTLYCEAGNGRR